MITSLIKNTESNVHSQNDQFVNTKDEINLYVSESFKTLYNEKSCDIDMQNFFLSQIQSNITDSENEDLVKYVDEEEIYSIIKNMNLNKSPGIDGIPLEFFIYYWDIIKPELCLIYNSIIDNLCLKGSQYIGIISLIYKGGEEENLDSWRPISLLCVDMKILAKVLAQRLKKPIINIIHKHQYCAPYRTIIDANNNIRDIIYFCNETNVPGVIVNLDWSKAFDKVDIIFLWRVMSKMGFSELFINILKIFYSFRKSQCIINGFLTEEFDIKRGVRQGCPLSMLLFILSQEPLYAAIENNNQIKPFKTPNSHIKLQGYADDTNFILSDDQSIKEVFRIVNMFESATSASLNLNKTKIFGIGLWKDRVSWPITNVNIQVGSMSLLGIKYTNNFVESAGLCWSDVNIRISKKVQTLYKRK